MAQFLVNLEIIAEAKFMSEIETAMHKMMQAIRTDVNISDYGLDVDYLD